MTKQQILRPLILKIQEGTLDWDNKLIIFYTRNQMAKWKIQRRIPKDHHRPFEMRRCLYACWCSFNMEQLSMMHGQGFSQELFQEWFTFPPKKSQLDPYFWARSKESLGWGAVRGKLVLRSPGQGKSHCEDSTGVEALKRDQGLGKDWWRRDH